MPELLHVSIAPWLHSISSSTVHLYWMPALEDAATGQPEPSMSLPMLPLKPGEEANIISFSRTLCRLPCQRALLVWKTPPKALSREVCGRGVGPSRPNSKMPTESARSGRKSCGRGLLVLALSSRRCQSDQSSSHLVARLEKHSDQRN